MSDHRAFSELWDQEYARVFRVAYLITGDRQEAADVTQEAFVRAYERWDSVSKLDRPGAWIQRVATNLAISWWRRQRARRSARHAAAAVFYDLEVPDADLLAALRRLSPAQRAVVVLRFYGDQSIAEVARALRRRPGTVKALTSQALSRLRELLTEAEYERRQ